MNSFPFISHHLFVAAIHNEDGPQPKRARSQATINLAEPARAIPREHTDGTQPLRTVTAQTLIEPDCLMGL
jgi:hypothetical protein